MAEAPGESDDGEYDQDDVEQDSDDHESFKEQVKVFKEKDAILEPGIFKILEDYLDMGGKESSVARHLSSSYCGRPLMINTLLDWLHSAGCRKKEIQVLIEDHLKQLVLRHFDPKKADLIFTETEEGTTPSWLEEMISFSPWRELFYQLAEQYPNCLMLKFTIKLISDAGYRGEITSASTAAYQPEVFCGLVKNLLSQIIKACNVDLRESFSEFCQLVCHSQHTYFYSQAMVQALEQQNTHKANFTRWLSGEVQKEARKRNLDVTNMTLHFNGVGRHNRIFEALGSMLSRNALNPADVTILYRCYADEEDPPQVRFLWNAQFLELLVQTLFKLGSTVNPDHKEKYIFLLAYATSVYETKDENGDDVVIKSELAATREAIDTACTICSNTNDSQAELLTKMTILFECLKYPIVSMGVLRWLESTLIEPSFFEVSAETSSLFLVLVDEIASLNPLQHSFVLDLLKRLLEMTHPSMEVHVQMELKRGLVDHLIHLLSCGHVIPVVSYIHSCMNTELLDHSLIRHFVSEVLSIVQPPYSGDFTSAFLPLLHNDEITGPLRSSNSDDQVSLFLADCPRRVKKKKKSRPHAGSER